MIFKFYNVTKDGTFVILYYYKLLKVLKLWQVLNLINLFK